MKGANDCTAESNPVVIRKMVLAVVLIVTVLYCISIWKPVWLADLGYWSGQRPKVECVQALNENDVYETCHLFFITGELRSILRRKNSLPHGRQETYFSDGQLHEEGMAENGSPTGTAVRYWPDGKKSGERIYKEGNSSVAKSYYQSGELQAVTYLVDGQPHGPDIFYDKNGFVIREWTSVHGQRLDTNGSPLNGLIRENFPNGETCTLTDYLNGRQNGLARGYYENGRIYWKCRYKNGKLHGRCKEYYPNGGLRLFMVFDDDQWYHEREYDKEGRLIYWAHYGNPRSRKLPRQTLEDYNRQERLKRLEDKSEQWKALIDKELTNVRTSCDEGRTENKCSQMTLPNIEYTPSVSE